MCGSESTEGMKACQIVITPAHCLQDGVQAASQNIPLPQCSSAIPTQEQIACFPFGNETLQHLADIHGQIHLPDCKLRLGTGDMPIPNAGGDAECAVLKVCD